MRRRASPVTEISVVETEISVTGMKYFPIWTLQPGYRDENFSTTHAQTRSQGLSPRFAPFSTLFHPGNRAEISHMNRRQNSSRLPGSYEEALNRMASPC